MNTIMNKKRIIIISIAVLFLSIGILLSVIFVEKNNPHPNIVRPGNDIKLENITFSKQIKQPVDTTKKVYKNIVDLQSSLDLASQCLNYDLLKEDYKKLPGNETIRKYVIPTGEVYVEEDTGYWSYTSTAYDSLIQSEEKAIVSDNTLLKKTRDFIETYNICKNDTYNLNVTETTTGGWNSDEQILAKDVYVFPNINDTPVYGVYRFVLSYDMDGEIIAIKSFFNPAAVYQNVPLKKSAELESMIKTGECSINAESSMEKVDIKSIDIAYYADSSPNEKGEFYIYPVYVLNADGVTIDGQSKSFDIFVDAIA